MYKFVLIDTLFVLLIYTLLEMPGYWKRNEQAHDEKQNRTLIHNLYMLLDSIFLIQYIIAVVIGPVDKWIKLQNNLIGITFMYALCQPP